MMVEELGIAERWLVENHSKESTAAGTGRMIAEVEDVEINDGGEV